MIDSKQEFLRTFLPKEVKDIHYAQIDLDINDLSLADILRNVNTTFPKNSRSRNAIASNELAVGILCKSEYLYPLSGLLVIVTGDDTDIQIVSKNYIVIAVSESKIESDEEIKIVIDHISKYIIKEFKNSLEDFNSFYVKYIYDEDEQYLTEDEYFV